MCAAFHNSVLTLLCSWSGLFGRWGHFSGGFSLQMLLYYIARLKTMYVYSAPVPQWPVDQYNLQPDVIGACVCDGGGEYWSVQWLIYSATWCFLLKGALCNKVLVFLPLPLYFPHAQLNDSPSPSLFNTSRLLAFETVVLYNRFSVLENHVWLLTEIQLIDWLIEVDLGRPR